MQGTRPLSESIISSCSSPHWGGGLRHDNQVDSRKYIVGTSMTPAFVITSLRSGEVANSLAFFVSVVSKMMTISFLSSAERRTRGLLKPAAFCIAECESNAGRQLP